MGFIVYLWLFLGVAGSFDVKLGWFSDHWGLTIIIIVAGALLIVIVGRILWHRFQKTWENAKEGGAIVADRKKFMTQVVGVEALSYVARMGVNATFMYAYNIPVSVTNVFLIVAAASISSTVAVAPGAVGAQTALAQVVLAPVASPAAITTYTVGQALITTAWNAVFGLTMLARTIGWKDTRALIHFRKKKDDEARSRAAGAGDVAGVPVPARRRTRPQRPRWHGFRRRRHKDESRPLQVVVLGQPAHGEESPERRQVERAHAVDQRGRERGLLGHARARSSPTVSPNSVTPMPPGTGMKVANSDTLRLITSRSASEMCGAQAARDQAQRGGEQHLGGEVPTDQHRQLVRAAQRRQGRAHLRPPLAHAARNHPPQPAHQVNTRMLTTASPIRTNSSFLAPSVGTSKSTEHIRLREDQQQHQQHRLKDRVRRTSRSRPT